MATETDFLDRVYQAGSLDELMAAYDDWAESYDTDLQRSGYRLPAVAATLIGRHVPEETAPVLDAGCGTGIIGEALSIAGYEGLHGLDLSEGMLGAARGRGVYDRLHRASLAGPLDFPDGRFGAVVAVGVLTKGHVGPEDFAELLRVTAPGGRLIFTIRVDGTVGEPYLARMDELERDGRWRQVAATRTFASMPAGEPDVRHRVFVYRAAGAEERET